VKSAVFDDPNLVSSAGLVPAVKLATRAGLAVAINKVRRLLAAIRCDLE
jgi:hypothetical protein